MTSTSFNPIQLKQTTIQQTQPMQLKQGQVFHGTVKQLYPDQMAEIQVGNQKMFAKLETPLKAGDAHYFQVTNMNPHTELKVVSGPMGSTMSTSQQIQTLMDSLQLPKSVEMQQLLAHHIKNDLPISKEQLVQGEVWLKNLPEGMSKQEGLTAIQKMIEAKMPFTNDVFKALLYGAKTEGMSQSIQNLIHQLQQFQGGTSQLQAVKENMLVQLQQIQTPFDGEKGGLLLARTIQTLVNHSESLSAKQEALTLLKQSNILPSNATIQNWLSSIQQTPTNSSSVNNANAGQLIQSISTSQQLNSQMIEQIKGWISNQQLLSDSQKNELLQLIQRFEGMNGKNQTTQLINQLQHQLIKMFANNSMLQLFSQDSIGHSSKDQLLSLFKQDVPISEANTMLRNIVNIASNSNGPFIQNLLTTADAQLQSAIDSKSMAQAVQQLVQQLGISYEAQLANKAATIQEIAQSLKPQLLAMMQNAEIPTAMKETAEQLIARMNGMQLLSSENGHQHQLVMQLPLQFLGRKMDATLQWNGRMKENGKIDADFARIMFYLNMESLEETVIDMQVQNRIVTLNIYNDNKQLDQLAEPLKQSLKSGLNDVGYQLSGVIIKPFVNETTVTTNAVKTTSQSNIQTGVDIRI